MKHYLIALLSMMAIVGMSSCDNDEPSPTPTAGSFVTAYVAPLQIVQCDTTISLPCAYSGKPSEEGLFTMLTGTEITPTSNPEGFLTIAHSKGDTGYTGTPFHNIECLSEPILAIKVIADEDVTPDIPKGTDMADKISMKIADLYDFVSTGYGWVLGTSSAGKAYTWYRGTVSGYTPENGRMADPRSIEFSISDRDLRAALIEKLHSGMIHCKILVTLSFPSGDISASVYAYTILATDGI